jgi:hypothetical protein
MYHQMLVQGIEEMNYPPAEPFENSIAGGTKKQKEHMDNRPGTCTLVKFSATRVGSYQIPAFIPTLMVHIYALEKQYQLQP